MKARGTYFFRSLMTGASLFAASPGLAQAAAESASEDGLEEIVVTAQRKSENLQVAPISVAAFSGDSLAEKGVTNVENLAAQTPSLSVKSDFGAANPNIYIRGVGIGDFNANVTGAVGVYVDDVYISAPAGQLMQFYDVDRLEVLRGPQGTLYGRNTTAGAINIHSKRPTEELSLDARLSYGRFDEVQAEGGLGFGIVPGLIKARISGNFHKRDGYIKNTFAGTASNPLLAPARVADIDSWAARAQLEITPSANASFLLNAHYGTSDTSGVRFGHRGLLDPVSFAAGQPTPCSLGQLDKGYCVDALGYAEGDSDPDTVQYNNPLREKLSAWGTNFKAEIGLGDYSLTSISAYERVKRRSVFDGDESPLSLLDAVHQPKYRQFTQEIRIASPSSDRFSWVAGGFYFNEHLDFTGTFDLFRQVRPAIAAAAQGLGLGPPLSLGFNPTGGPALAAQLGNPIFGYPTISPLYVYDQRVESWAAFGQAYYDLSDKLTATFGLRYSSERRRFDYNSSLVEPFITIPLAENSAALGNNRTSFEDVSFRLALEFRANDNLFFFGSVSRGSKSGGFNGALLLNQAQTVPFGDETITSYELGMKSEWLNRRLRLNVTSFYYDYKDLQVFTLANAGGIPQQILSNAPGARVYGGELELVAQPSRRWQFGAGLSLLDSKIDKSFIGPKGVDLRGNKLAYSPPVSVTGNAQYSAPLGQAGEIVLQGDFSFVDASFTDTGNSPLLKTESGFTVNGRIAYQSANKGWEISLYGRNIFNERYITYVADLSDFGFQRVQYNEPPTYGVGLKLKL